MALPKLEVPSYPITLPSNKKKLKFRPFVVKERSILLLALQEGNTEGIIEAVDELFKACTFGACTTKNLSLVDTEYLFLKIRSKSIGEELDVIHHCIQCDQENEVRLNLEDLAVEGLGASTDIDLGNNVFLKMKHPTLELASLLSDDPTEEEVLKVIGSCIDAVIQGDIVYKAIDSTEEEIRAFIDDLTQGQLNKIQAFFASTPKIVVGGSYTCRHCNTVNNIKVEGLENFFA